MLGNTVSLDKIMVEANALETAQRQQDTFGSLKGYQKPKVTALSLKLALDCHSDKHSTDCNDCPARGTEVRGIERVTWLLEQNHIVLSKKNKCHFETWKVSG